jgi:hypothetical protein
MAEGKYSKYFIKDPVKDGKFAPILYYHSEFPGTDFTIRWHYITEPWLMDEKPHSHDFDQFSFFIGGNPMDITDFGAEVETYLGEEGEKYIINTTTILYIPKGLIHAPLNFKRIDRPIMFMNIPLTAQYVRKTVST